MDYRQVEKKWQQRWADDQLYAFDENNMDKKLYVLEMFSYPSAAKLHVGHWYNYGPSDTYARFKRMQGFNVFHPMGFDAFGLPAENYAIQTGIHPQDSTLANMEDIEKQLRAIGATFDWNYTLRTCMPDYYRWTQWLFIQLYQKGLAYRAEAPVNWCPGCNTVLANEQVIDGLCERCDSVVVRKNLTQWFFKITDYAEELLQKLDGLDWPEKTKAMQRNWIGKSVGAEIVFDIVGGGSFPVFTTRPDTLLGSTYCVLAPEHPLVSEITAESYRDRVQAYQKKAAEASEIERLSTAREKTGVFTGAYAVNPLNREKLPIYIADYVLYSYGTGAVMAVPAHDERDYEFARKYALPIVKVVAGPNGGEELPYTGPGTLVNSGAFDGLDWEAGKTAVIEALVTQKKGNGKVNYRMRDWLISRQRYWGTPIPMVHCDHCGVVPVPLEDLPVLLPYDVDFTPDGTSPLASHEGFIHTTCPVCGALAKRDPDTMDTFVCSSWYFLRYPDNRNESVPFDPATINKLLPVDKYIGGPEHAVMHLLYARFFTKALRDMGYVSFDEPFTSLVHQGMILGEDGEKISKSRGNAISPDDYIEVYGTDVFRMYLMFGFNYVDGGPWSDGGIRSVARFLDRVERLVSRVLEKTEGKDISVFRSGDGSLSGVEDGVQEKQLRVVLANTIRCITQDVDRFMFNTSIARLMELVNALYKYLEAGTAERLDFLIRSTDTLLKLMSPFAPHFSEELNERIGGAYSITHAPWPTYHPNDLVQDEISIAVQVSGKLRGRIDVPKDAESDEIEKIALADSHIAGALTGKTIQKVIVVKGRLINIVAS